MDKQLEKFGHIFSGSELASRRRKQAAQDNSSVGFP
jgi:hypothetical protein